MPMSLLHISWRFSTWHVITLSNTTHVVLLITNFNSHIDDLSCISDPVPGPPLLQWSCPLAPSATKLPVSLSRRLSYTWMFSINSISNISFSTILQLALSRFPIPSILQQLQDLYSNDPMPSSLTYILHSSYFLASFLIKLKCHDWSHCFITCSSLILYVPAKNPNLGNVQFSAYIHEAECD